MVILHYPQRSLPLCEGSQDCSLYVQNDSIGNYRMEMSSDGGRSWQQMGLLDAQNQTQFWRQSGEQWRLVCFVSGEVGARLITTPGISKLRVARSVATTACLRRQPFSASNCNLTQC
jgi:hypothetical protein